MSQQLTPGFYWTAYPDGSEIAIREFRADGWFECGYATACSEDMVVRSAKMEPPPPTDAWPIWSEGYAVTGQSSGAAFHGYVQADSFREACRIKFCDDTNFRDGRPPSLWGCRLFDNEEDARKAFG